MKPVPTLARINEILRLDHETGKLYRRVRTSRGNRAGDEAGGLSSRDGYLRVSIDGTQYLAHRVVFALANGRWPEGQVDHANMDRGDNRPSNLREASNGQNAANRPVQSRSKSGVKGVYFEARRGRWTAVIRCENRVHWIGRFAALEDAERAYREAAARLHGEFART